MGLLETVNDYKQYKQWQDEKHARQHFHDELLKSNLSREQLGQAQALQRVVYDSFEKMDDMSQIYEQKVGAYLQAGFLFVTLGLSAFLLKNTQKLMHILRTMKYKDVGKRFTNLLIRKPNIERYIHTFAGILPALIQLPVLFWASKEASRLARHMARQQMNVKDFALYTPEQLKEAQAKSQYQGIKVKYISDEASSTPPEKKGASAVTMTDLLAHKT